MKLAEILSGATIVRQDADPLLEISGITADSRLVEPGYMFAAVPGFKVDGHDFVPAARKAGAAGILTQTWLEGAETPQVQVPLVRKYMALAAANFYGRPSNKLTLVGVTGTNGKTTTTFLIDAILAAAGRNTGLVGGIEYRLGNRTLTAERTTPESSDLQKMLDDMSSAGVDTATLEVSSHGIGLYRVAYTDFDVAVFTNLTRDHLDLHHDMESYFNTKRRLFTAGLENDEPAAAADGKRPAAVINIDDAYGRRLAAELENGVVTFGIEARTADVTAKNITHSGWNTHFEVVTPAASAPVRLRLPGAFNIYNALAAAAVGVTLKLPLETIATGLNACRGVPGRFELVDSDSPFKIVIDYAHNEDGLSRAIGTARGAAGGKLIVVFGCPGERDRDKRPRMGEIAGSRADLAILTTDDCYGEAPERILDEVEPGLGKSGGRYIRIADRRAAIEAAIGEAGPGDLVLIAGKGHETKQIMAQGPVPFSDRDVVAKILAGK